jgi:hypothetical protein
MQQNITLPPAAMLAISTGYTQQPTPAFTFRTLVSAGDNIGGSLVNAGATIEASP